MAANNIELTLVGRFVDKMSTKAKAVFSQMSRMASGVGRAVGGLSAVFGAFGASAQSSLGKAAQGVGNVIGALATMGPAVAVVTAVGAAFEFFSTRAKRAAEASLEFAKSMREAVSKKLAEVRAKEIESVNAQLDAAVSRADKAAKAFDDVAESFMKVAKAKDASAAASDDLAEAELRAEKQRAVAKAGSPDAAAKAAADYDVKLASQKLERTGKDAAIGVEDAQQGYRFALERLSLAKKREAAITDELIKAETELEERSGVDAEFDRALRARRDKAAKAAEAATEQRNKAETAVKVADEAVKAARLKQSKAVTDAATNLAEAEDARKKLDEEQKRAGRERIAADKEAAIAHMRAARDDALAAAKRAKAAEAEAMGRYNDPKAANAANKAAKRAERDSKTFDRRAERLMKREDWRTADNLMSADSRIRDVLLARERADVERKEADSLEKNMASAAADLAEIRKDIAKAVTI